MISPEVRLAIISPSCVNALMLVIIDAVASSWHVDVWWTDLFELLQSQPLSPPTSRPTTRTANNSVCECVCLTLPSLFQPPSHTSFLGEMFSRRSSRSSRAEESLDETPFQEAANVIHIQRTPTRSTNELVVPPYFGTATLSCLGRLLHHVPGS